MVERGTVLVKCQLITHLPIGKLMTECQNKSLGDVVVSMNPMNSHGQTSLQLSQKLVMYLRSETGRNVLCYRWVLVKERALKAAQFPHSPAFTGGKTHAPSLLL